MQANEYIAVMLGTCRTTLYRGSENVLQQEAVVTADCSGCGDDIASRAYACHQAAALNNSQEMEKGFIEQVGDVIKALSKQYAMPVYIFGTASTIACFKKINNQPAINTYFLPGQYRSIVDAGLGSIILSCFTPHY